MVANAGKENTYSQWDTRKGGGGLRCSGLMVSALDSGSSSPGLSLSRVILVRPCIPDRIRI